MKPDFSVTRATGKTFCLNHLSTEGHTFMDNPIIRIAAINSNTNFHDHRLSPLCTLSHGLEVVRIERVVHVHVLPYRSWTRKAAVDVNTFLRPGKLVLKTVQCMECLLLLLLLLLMMMMKIQYLLLGLLVLRLFISSLLQRTTA